MDTKDLRCFRQVNEDRSINQAAKQLLITPQGLSSNLKKETLVERIRYDG